MQCPKCRQDNPDQARFCVRCHAPLKYVCPACQHTQAQGGKCEQCGVDFAKYAAALLFKASEDSKQERERARDRASLLKQVLLAPFTSGLSILKYFRSQFRGQ